MQLTVRATGTDELELLKALEAVVHNIRTRQLHCGNVQQATGSSGFYANWKFDDVDPQPMPVAQPVTQRPSFTAMADSLTPTAALPSPTHGHRLSPAPHPSLK